MKTSKIIAAAALSLLAAAGAHAETYEGVHPLTNQRARAEVIAEAAQAARAGDRYAEAAFYGVAPAMANPLSRSAVRAEAYAAAHSPVQNVGERAFVNSVTPAQYQNAVAKLGTSGQAL